MTDEQKKLIKLINDRIVRIAKTYGIDSPVARKIENELVKYSSRNVLFKLRRQRKTNFISPLQISNSPVKDVSSYELTKELKNLADLTNDMMFTNFVGKDLTEIKKRLREQGINPTRKAVIEEANWKALFEELIEEIKGSTYIPIDDLNSAGSQAILKYSSDNPELYNWQKEMREKQLKGIKVSYRELAQSLAPVAKALSR